MRYRLKEKLIPVQSEDKLREDELLVELLSVEEYRRARKQKAADYRLLQSLEVLQYCKVDMLKDCMIGTFVIPSKQDLLGSTEGFGFYLDKYRITFVGDEEYVLKILCYLEQNQVWESAGIHHFLFTFIEYLIHDEIRFLQKYEERLTDLEECLTQGKGRDSDISRKILHVRRELLRLNSYYNQLMDMSDTMIENYNRLLDEEDRVLFQLLSGRLSRLSSHVKNLRDYALQIREMYQTQNEVHQNEVMQLLTVVTAIFMPLTLITGWYGMNFIHMPELAWKYAYPVTALVGVVLVILEILYFWKKKWF